MQPLVPADVDLRGLPFMPLDVNRLRDSDLSISATGDEFRAAVLLWCASWNQVPAASLPDDDKTLAAYAGYGRDLKGWKKVKAGAMRGFVQCDNGRWYHPVVAEKAMEAWEERVDYRDKRDNEAERLRRYRIEHKELRDELRSYGVVCGWNEKIEALRERAQYERQQRNRTPPETRTGPLPVTAKTGTGTGTGIKDQELQGGSADADPPPDESVESPPAKADPIPYQAIVDAYNSRLTQLASVRLVTGNRRTAIRRAWLSLPPEHRRVGAFKAIFAECAMDDFLNGNGPYTGEHANWRPDFDHLIKTKTLTKVYEKAMARRDRMRQQQAAATQAGAAA